MNQKIISEIGRSQRLAVVNLLKRGEGLAVSELSARLGMSYMGVKQHCLSLEKDGYLDTWRRPRENSAGRPEMVYRLTRRAQALFPAAANEMTIALLAEAQKLYGAHAPEKLLFSWFQGRRAFYQQKIRGDTLRKRALWLARLRDNEGYMADFVDEPEPAIVEHHSPIFDLLEAYPIVARLEQELFSAVLGAPVRREHKLVSGLYRCSFRLPVK